MTLKPKKKKTKKKNKEKAFRKHTENNFTDIV